MSRRQRVPSNLFYRKADPVPPLYPEPWEGDTYFNTERKVLRIYTDGQWQDLNAMRWSGEYSPNEDRWYYPGDVVKDGDWVMMCVNTTHDRPAPQLLGEPYYLYEGASPTATVSTPTLQFGTRFAANTQAVVVQGWRIWAQKNIHYSAWLVENPDTAPIYTPLLDGDDAGTDGWTEIFVRSTVLRPGTIFDIRITARPPTSTLVGTGQWDYRTPNNESVPGEGEVVQSHKLLDSLRFHKTDSNGSDRGADLLSLHSGDVITAQDTEWTIIRVRDRTTWVEFTVAPARLLAEDGLTDFSVNATASASITYVHDPGYWSTRMPSANGLWNDGSGWATDSDAYGVDIKIQQVSISEDWVIVSNLGGVGGGGGGGGIEEAPDDGLIYGRSSRDWVEVGSSSEHNHDLRYEPLGTVADHEAAADPHPNYLTPSEADANYASSAHDHDNRYYTESETDSLLAGKSDTAHDHDSRYYTESEVDTALAGKSDTSHLHDSRYYTESEVDSKLAGKSDTSHDHAGTYEPAGAVAAHEGEADPHPQYLTQSEADGLYNASTHDHDAEYVSKTGDTMSGELDMGGQMIRNTADQTTVVPNDHDVVSKAYVDQVGGQSAHGSLGGLDLDQHQHYAPVEIVEGEETPSTAMERPGKIVLRLNADPSNALEFVPTQGGTMTGPLLLAADPSTPMEAATKQYVDSGAPIASSHDHDADYAPLNHDHSDLYYTETETDALLDGKSDIAHDHDSRYYTETETDSLLAGKSDTAHNHDADYEAAGAVAAHEGKTDPHPQYLTQAEADGLYNASTHDHDSDYAPLVHDHDSRYYTETEADALLAGKSDTSHNHDADYAAASHNHDSRYYTETEVDTKLAAKSDTTHNHDSRYYTESEVDDLIANVDVSGHNHDADYVNTTGDTMAGALNMGGNTLWLNSAGTVGIRENAGAIEFVV